MLVYRSVHLIFDLNTTFVVFWNQTWKDPCLDPICCECSLDLCKGMPELKKHTSNWVVKVSFHELSKTNLLYEMPLSFDDVINSRWHGWKAETFTTVDLPSQISCLSIKWNRRVFARFTTSIKSSLEITPYLILYEMTILGFEKTMPILHELPPWHSFKTFPGW